MLINLRSAYKTFDMQGSVDVFKTFIIFSYFSYIWKGMYCVHDFELLGGGWGCGGGRGGVVVVGGEGSCL